MKTSILKTQKMIKMAGIAIALILANQAIAQTNLITLPPQNSTNQNIHSGNLPSNKPGIKNEPLKTKTQFNIEVKSRKKSDAQTGMPQGLMPLIANVKKGKYSRSASAFPTNIFSEDFGSADSIPAGWLNKDLNDTGLVWKWNKGYSYGDFPQTLDPNNTGTSASNGYVMFDSDGQNQSYGGELAFLTTPMMNCSTNKFVYLELEHFFKRHINNNGYVLISTDTLAWDTIFRVSDFLYINQSTANPEKLGGFVTQWAAYQPKVWFKFVWEGDYDYYWFVDDISVYEPKVTDLALTLLNDFDELYCDQYTDTFRVYIVNLGNDTISNFEVAYSKNNGTPVIETINDTILPGDTIWHTFSKSITFNADKETSFLLYSKYLGDQYGVNDTVTVSAKATSGGYDLSITSPYKVGFEINEKTYEWAVENADGDGFSFSPFNNPALANTGDYSILYLNGNVTSANDWLYIRCIGMDTGKTYSIKFYYWAYNTEYDLIYNLSVNMGTAANISSMTQNIANLTGIPEANGYVEYFNENITVTTPGDYFIGFNLTGINAFAFFIDDIEIDTVPEIDIGVISIEAPGLNCSYGASDTVKITIQNFGTEPVSNFNVTYKFPGTEETENVSATINPDSTYSYTFKALADLTNVIDSIKFKAFTIEDRDLVYENDTTMMWLFPVTPLEITNKKTMSFEDTADFTGWVTYDANKDGKGFDYLGFPFTNAVFANTGTNSALYFADNDPADDWVFSSCIELDSAVKYELHHYYLIDNNPAQGGSGVDKYRVLLMSDRTPADSSMLIWDFGSIPYVSLAYRDTALQFIAPNSGTYYIGFHLYTPTATYAFAIDDISIRPAPDYELQLVDLISPEPVYCGQPDSVPVTVVLVNDGENYVTNFNVNYAFDTLNTVSELISDTLWKGDLLTYTFKKLIDLSTLGVYNFKAFINIPSDADFSNDSIITVISSVAVHNMSTDGALTMGFEMADTTSTDDFTGWSIENVGNQANTWEIRNTYSDTWTTMYPNSGGYFIQYYYHSTNKANDWFFTKCVEMDTAINYTLKFKYRASSGYFEKLRVGIGISPSYLAMTDTLVDFGAFKSTAYKDGKVVFSVPAKGSYYIGFHAYSDADMWYLSIDDIELKASATLDAGIISLDTKSTECGLGNSNKVSIEIVNSGLDTIGNFDVYFKVNDTIYKDTVGTAIAPGDTLYFTFTPTADFSALTGEYTEFTIVAYTDLTGDEENSNDTITKIIYSVVSHDFQGKPISTSLEDSEDFIGFDIQDVNADDLIWDLRTFYARTGTNSLIYYHNLSIPDPDPVVPADDWFLVRCGDLDSGAVYEVSFYHRVGLFFEGSFFDQSGFTEKLRVAAIIDTQSYVGRTIDILKIDEITNTSYAFVSDTFHARQAGTYYIGFQVYNDFNYVYKKDGTIPIYSIDDIEIRKVKDNDVGVIDIQPITAACALSGTEQVVTSVKNYALKPISNFDVQYSINGGAAVVENIKDTLDYNQVLNYGFTAKANLAATGTYTVKANTKLTGDAFAGNDSYSTTATSISPHNPKSISEGGDGTLSYGFETTDDGLGWLVGDDANNDEVTWYTVSGFQNNGDFSIICYKNDNGFTASNDWFYSKCLDLEADTNYILSFFYMTTKETQKLKVLMGNDQTTSAMTDLVIDLGNITSESIYTEVVSDTIRVSTSGTYYLGFNLYSSFNISGEQYISVDDISLDVVSKKLGINARDIKNTGNISLYPNPSESNFTLEMNFPVKQDFVQIEVCNVLGNVVYSLTKENVKTEKVVIDMSDESNGIYFLNIKTDNEKLVQKMVITK